MSYQHPGYAFLAQHEPIRQEADLLAYVSFLLESAGLDGEPPVDLGQIYRHFEMPQPQRAPLTEQQGVLVDGDRGLILIKADDPVVRQRFTEGHELMELLFEAQEQAHQHPDPHQAPASWQVQGDRKEQLCDRLAAELLMPRHSFRARLRYLGSSMATAKTLASDYQTSLLATLLRMMQVGEGAHGLVVWRLGWATAQLRPRVGSRRNCGSGGKQRRWLGQRVYRGPMRR
ncbi:MAG: ImmA/IrrE family metallo-endopeptidase [Synechococcales cyanobacterium CRU_2_2]|nr:ImmA/IrrE family metallo-endopeptidase [Synechococcales cyanobacterium CRU_2_2]